MSELDRAVDARLDAFRPERTPPIEGLLIRRHRRDRRRASAALLATALAAAAIVVVPYGLRGTHTGAVPLEGGPVVGGNAGLGPDSSRPLPALRPLPTSALLQVTLVGGGAPPQQPELPEVQTRVYDDGTLLSATGRTAEDRWQQTQLSDAELARARRLVADAGLAAGHRDYGSPTNAGGISGAGRVFEVDGQDGAEPSLVEYGATTNGVPSSDAQLSQAQRDARARIAELIDLLDGATARGTTAYRPPVWSRYAQPTSRTPTIDTAASPRWTSLIPLNDGQHGSDGLRCTPVDATGTDRGSTRRDGQYRVGDTAWEVRYDAVLPGEPPCSAVAASLPAPSAPAAVPTASAPTAPARPADPAVQANCSVRPYVEPGAVVTVTLNGDTPAPRCVAARRDQTLDVSNNTGNDASVTLGPTTQHLPAGGHVRFDLADLARGVHYLDVAGAYGGCTKGCVPIIIQ